jgi:hypothetical protein
MQKSMHQKLGWIVANRGCRDLIPADAKDGDTALRMAPPIWHEIV